MVRGVLKEYYGSTTVGERGQIVLPAKLRKDYGVKKGEKLLVLSGEGMGGWGIVLIKPNIVTKLASKTGIGELFKKRD
ncbi:MAG: AbrB/MazE/SpoVT family DNA-binding domain-containing protein [Candidatus Aenigmarchaeota archaeon]|nr:AbrB/MazE/SpoVT family DNA-binding domain-containing protein [Candidatus Aenigmarchaeota archaeon]